MRALALSLALLFAPSPAMAEGPEPVPPRVAGAPDFSGVLTNAAAERLVAEGRLVRVLIYPGELGGEDVPANTGYMTPEAAEARLLLIGTLTRFANEGLIDRLSVEPKYRGDSRVPAAIAYRATHSSKPTLFEPTIHIW